MPWDLPRIYVAINALLYVAFAVLCAVRGEDSARSLGYAALTDAGRSEYLVVYGGLQLGLGIYFAIAAFWRTAYVPSAAIFALALYAPIVLFRWATVLRFHVREPMTLGVGALETLLLIFAVVAVARLR